MDATPGLTSEAFASPDSTVACPACNEAASCSPQLPVALVGPTPLFRCLRCGTRATVDSPPRLLLSCSECGFPFLQSPAARAGTTRCDGCRTGAWPEEASPEVALAAEHEVLAGLRSRWSWVGDPRITAYLRRVRSAIQSEVSSGPASGEILLFADDRYRLMGLPSGRLLMSTGVLMCLADEAEFAFVMARELCHVGRGAAGAWLVRLGLVAVADRGEGDRGESWAAVAETLLRIGFGAVREYEADRVALAAIIAAGYDASAPVRLLDRMHQCCVERSPEWLEACLALPPATERRRRIEDPVRRQRTEFSGRTNREVYRRVLGHGVIASGLESASPPAPTTEEAVQSTARLHRGILWGLVALVLLAGVLLAFAWL